MAWFARLRSRASNGRAQLSTPDEQTAIAEPTPAAAPSGRARGPKTTVTAPVREAAAWSWRVLIIGVAVTVLILGLIQLKTVVVPVLVATLIASLLYPLVHWLQRVARFPRALAVTSAMVLALGFIGSLLVLAGNSIFNGLPALWARAGQGFQDALDWLSSSPLALDQTTLTIWLDQVQEQFSANADALVSGALSVTASAGHVAAGVLISLFCLFFFLKDGRTIWTWGVGLFPRAARRRVDGAGLRAWQSLGSYARTQIIVAFVDAVGIALGAWALGVPLVLPLAVIVFVGAFIPIVGALISGSVAVAVALVDGGLWTAVLMLVVVLVVQQIEGHLLQPLLMSRALKLHPVAVLLGVATGTLVGGIVGALFAVPIIAVLNTAMKYLNGTDTAPEPLRHEFDEMTRRWARV